MSVTHNFTQADMYEKAKTIEDVLVTFLAIENPTEAQLIEAWTAEELLRPEPTEAQLWESLYADAGRSGQGARQEAA